MTPIHVHIHCAGRVRSFDAFPDSHIGHLAARLAAALSLVQGRKTKDEKEGHEFHGNQYTTVAGAGGEEPAGEKPIKATEKGVKSGVHQLLSTGHAFTIKELQLATEATTEKQISDALAMLKNPKYAGSKGTLEIVKVPGGYAVKKKAPAAAPAAPAIETPSPAPVAAPEPAQTPPQASPELTHAEKKAKADLNYDQGMKAALGELDHASHSAKSIDQMNEVLLKFKESKAALMVAWAK